jgi:hypothetical protein
MAARGRGNVEFLTQPPQTVRHQAEWRYFGLLLRDKNPDITIDYERILMRCMSKE